MVPRRIVYLVAFVVLSLVVACVTLAIMWSSLSGWVKGIGYLRDEIEMQRLGVYPNHRPAYEPLQNNDLFTPYRQD